MKNIQQRIFTVHSLLGFKVMTVKFLVFSCMVP